MCLYIPTRPTNHCWCWCHCWARDVIAKDGTFNSLAWPRGQRSHGKYSTNGWMSTNKYPMGKTNAWMSTNKYPMGKWRVEKYMGKCTHQFFVNHWDIYDILMAIEKIRNPDLNGDWKIWENLKCSYVPFWIQRSILRDKPNFLGCQNQLVNKELGMWTNKSSWGYVGYGQWGFKQLFYGDVASEDFNKAKKWMV